MNLAVRTTTNGNNVKNWATAKVTSVLQLFQFLDAVKMSTVDIRTVTLYA
jgi:hypothetical protein